MLPFPHGARSPFSRAVRPVARAAVLTLVAGLVLTTRPSYEPAPALQGRATPPAVHTLALDPVAPTAHSAAGKQVVASLTDQHTDGFTLLGVTWDDAAAGADLDVAVRTRDEHGWTDWTTLHIDPDEGPTPGQEVGGRGGTEPLWVGASSGVQVRVRSERQHAPRGVRVDLVDPGTAAESPSLMGYTDPSPRPQIVTRQQWGADESYGDTCWQPRYADSIHAVFLHHTAGSNSYSQAESAGIVRGIYAYHTLSRGWCDIGYNFLVDRYGTIYEGRRGGIDKPVRGSHAGDANLGSVGISLMGNFESVAPTSAMKSAVVDLVSWEIGSRYLDPLGTTTELPDQPYDRDGKPFPVISGHRDAMYTACPGQKVYAWLPTLRALVAERIGEAQSPIEERWTRLGGERSRLGAPFTGERADGTGRSTRFDHGTMYWSPRTPARILLGAIKGRYQHIGGTTSFLGFPTSDERDARVSSGRFNVFQRGGIYWSSKTGAHWVFAGINNKYNRVGGAVAIGLPVTDEIDAGVPGGRMNAFQRGDIYWSSSTGARAVYGAIRYAYKRIGGPAGIGLPTTDEFDAGVPGGRTNTFQSGRIYWSSGTGAHPVYGAVLGAYLRAGGPRSTLGLPVRDEYAVDGGRRQDFEGGSITWNSATRRATVSTTNAG